MKPDLRRPSWPLPRFRMAKRVRRYLHVSTKNGQIVENERPALGEAIDCCEVDLMRGSAAPRPRQMSGC